MGITEKIQEIEHEMSRTQKNKATNYHLGTLKAKLAKLKSELLIGESGGGGGGEKGDGFDVQRAGDARVALIGFPSVGKSSLLNKITNTESIAADYEFTTLTCIPGNLVYKGTKIQVLDLPGIIEGAAKGKGRGKEVIAVARSADLVLMVLDAAKEGLQRHRDILEGKPRASEASVRSTNVRAREPVANSDRFPPFLSLTHAHHQASWSLLAFASTSPPPTSPSPRRRRAGSSSTTPSRSPTSGPTRRSWLGTFSSSTRCPTARS